MADEPQTRGTVLVGFRIAALEVWGPEAIPAIAAELPEDASAATVDSVLNAGEWYPSRYVVAWHQAAYLGPARSDDARYRAFIGRSVDLGFWRVQRLLLKIATPGLLIERAADLWRRYHSHGTLELERRAETNAGTVTLRDHPFGVNRLSRLSLAEAFRSVVSMARAKNVRETHADGSTPGSLAVRITWE